MANHSASGSYFTMNDHVSLASSLTAQPQGTLDDTHPADSSRQLTFEKLAELHRLLHRRMRDRNWDLHPHWDRARVISSTTAACRNEIDGLTLAYLRSYEQVLLVERLMGREGMKAASTADSRRHPAIEVRVTPTNFAIELVLPPTAWWDQRNLIGKLSIARHRTTLRSMIQRMDGEYMFGFWDGCQLGEMHVTNRQIARGSYLDDWMSTFSDGTDWLRVGMWYEPEHEALSQERILPELIHRIGALYNLYTFLLWTGNNNFHSFYHQSTGAASSTPRAKDY